MPKTKLSLRQIKGFIKPKQNETEQTSTEKTKQQEETTEEKDTNKDS